MSTGQRRLLPGDPRWLGSYELLCRLGEGGMGTVFLGRGPDRRLVAVKMVRAEHAWDTEFRGRFRSEVNRAREVPGFCTAAVLDADPDHETPYLVVEYVDGPSLSEVIRERGPLDGSTLHSVAVGVATALAAIHGAGVIHRDLKPQNVLFSLGTPKVIDFGIARALEATSRHTRTDQMVGTVAYMAPERFETDTGDTVGPPADVFAWGVVVAYAATGRTPFAADSPAATAARILTQSPDLSGLPEPLRELVGSTLAKDPAQRPTAHELLDRLLEADSGGNLEVRPRLRRAAEAVQHPARSRLAGVRGQGRRRVGLAFAAVTVLMAGAGLVARQLHAGQPTARPGAGSSATAAPQLPAADVPRLQGPSVVDRLDRPAQWKPANEEAGTCTFVHRLIVATGRTEGYRCPGPQDTFSGDQSVATDVSLMTPNACATIWFRVVGRSSYHASFCRTEIRLGEDNGSGPDRTAASTAFGSGRTHRAGVLVRNGIAQVTVDGAAVLSMPLTDPLLGAGQVQLGATAQMSGERAAASFADVEVQSAQVGRPPAFPDLTKGTTRSVAKLYSYDPGTHAAVLQPVLMLTGEKYCTMFRIAPGQRDCQEPFRIVESREKLTLPVVDAPALLAAQKPDGDSCVVSMTAGGTCPATPAAFLTWLKANPVDLVAVTADGGRITRMAQILAT